MRTYGVVVAALLCLTIGVRGFRADAPLADAAEARDRAKVVALLKQGADVNAAQADGMTPLHWAAHFDDQDMADALLRAGAGVKAVTRYGVTPLSLACTNGSAAMIDRLLKAGADPNAALPGGETPLMTAARTGTLAAVNALVAAGAKVDGKDERRGQTALTWAVDEGHAGVVHALIAAGAEFRAPLPSGFTPLMLAVREGHANVVGVLVKAGVDVNEAVPSAGRRRGYGGGAPGAGTTPLLVAVRNGHFELASTLLDAGANPNANGTGYTVLHLISAIRKPGIGDNDPPPVGSGNLSSLELVKKLAAKGADVNARMTRRANINNTRANELGATPLWLAALTCDAELLKVLAGVGADPLAKNAENSTALMVAAGIASRSPGEDPGTERETVDTLQALLDLGVDINAVDNNGETAMHGAAYRNSPAAVKFLAAKGAKIDLWNKDDKFGWTPLAIAVGYRFGNFKPSPETEAAIREEMIRGGVTPPKVIVAKTQQIY
jgi:ankyrin repeat protein